MPDTKPLPELESIIDQKGAVANLTAIIQRETVPHAILFTGIEGVGKKTAAITFIMACNCTRRRISCNSLEADGDKRTGPCGECRSCRKILTGNHPDLIFINPSGAVIKISQIRELVAKLALKPYDDGYRAVIISDAEAMKKEAGNALLKILEEPPDRTVIILTARQTSDLLPTIVSRCRHIRFNPVSNEHIRSFLITAHGVDEDRAGILASLAEGSLKRAAEMNEGSWLQLRNGLIHELERIEKWNVTTCLRFAEILAGKKEYIQYVLSIIKTWFRDLVVYKYVPGKVMNKDLMDAVKRASGKMEVNTLMLNIKAAERVREAIDKNANLRLALENFAMEVANIEQ